MNDINTGVADAMRLLDEERLARVREIKRRWAAKKRAENPEAERERMREYMRKSGAAREYYRANRDVCLQRCKERYARKKAAKEAAEEAERLATMN
jgi:hypothetical protein